MINAVKFATSVLALATACLAQEGLTIDNKHKERVPQKRRRSTSRRIPSSRKKFVINYPIVPRVKLVLGANKNVVLWAEREMWLTRWDRYLFAQGVVMLAFADLLTGDRKIAMTKRAVNWTDSTVENRTTCKIAGWLATAEAVASSRAT
jgi:hypothetical protein